MKHFIGVALIILMPFTSHAVHLAWASYFGGSSDEYGFSSATDPSGNVYIVGNATSSSGVATAGAFQTAYGGIDDGFLAKFNSNGVIQWATYFGGSSIDQANAVACDAYGNVYITGVTKSTSGIATSQAYQTTKGGTSAGDDAFLAKFNASGSLIWSTYFGGSDDDEGDGISCDANGNVYITGQTLSTANIATSGAYQNTMGGVQDAFVAKFDSSGQIQWSTYYGGYYADRGNSISCDGSGNVFITGYTFSSNGIATTSGYQQTQGSNWAKDAFLAKFNSTGILQWGTYFGDSLLDEGFSVKCDASGNIYMGGITANGGLSTAGSYQPGLAGSEDGYLCKFSINGQLLWSTYYGGSSYDEITALALDNAGNIYIGGSTQSSSGVATAANYQSSLVGGGDGFLAKFNASGQRIWGTYYGGNSGQDYVFGLSTGLGGSVFFTGYTGSTSGIATPGAYLSSAPSSGYSTFIGKFSADTAVSIVQPFTDTLLCRGASFTLHYTVNNNFQSGNVFTAQLSDVFGTFLSPVNIGSVTALTSGTITCTIPTITLPTYTPGTGYRVRIYATNPSDTSEDNGISIKIDTTTTPSVNISSSPAVPVVGADTFTAVVSNAGTTPTYQWKNNAVNISGATSSTYIANLTAGDHITVLVHSSLPCSSPDSSLSNTLSLLGLEKISSGFADLNLFPNPNKGVFTIKGVVANDIYNLTITNTLGQVVFSKQLIVANGLLETSITPGIPGGIYTVQLDNSNASRSFTKLVITK